MRMITEEDKAMEVAAELSNEMKKEIPPATREKNTMVKNNKEVTSRPVPRRTEGGVSRTNEGGHAGTNEGGRQQHIIK